MYAFGVNPSLSLWVYILYGCPYLLSKYFYYSLIIIYTLGLLSCILINYYTFQLG